ncbi:MAG: pyridoxamine 5'-phosphate oxidase family protein [Bryobacterales bacterium]|nr:pyridoxamine 5'-phosphate oxidase family protein [Bryobacterales bacterium]
MKLPQPVAAADLKDTALETMRQAKFPVLATDDHGQPRARPVSPVRTEGFTVYIASLRSSNKTAELEANERAELCYLSDGHDQVRITGPAQLVTDAAKRQEIWDANPLLRAYLGTIDNPEFLLYAVLPERVRFMREWALEYQEVPLG